MSAGHPERKVYRLRNLPAHVDRLSATELAATAIDNGCVTPGDIQIFSLATIPDPWKRWQIKVATLMFKKTPSVLLPPEIQESRVTETTEWTFRVPGLPEPLILDTHFYGLTVLNDVNPSIHEYDCIVLSGLASHPFGSWQPKGNDKSFMWIRDVLPTSFPSIRFLLYGYNTTLANSKSFQTIIDLAGTLMLELEANGWATPMIKPLIFIAHSLGGVLLKQLLLMMAEGNNRATFILGMIKGAIFFGTPSVGMPLSNLLTMVESQPNKDFVEDLSDRSAFLKNLEIQFGGISFIGKMRLFWAYETKTSPTVVRTESGSYERSGPRLVMVDRQSATSGRCISNPASTIQIDEDHSSMVKFSLGDRRISTISSKIRDICWPEGQPSILDEKAKPPELQESEDWFEPFDDNDAEDAVSRGVQDANMWNYDLILQSLQPPERDDRLNQIDESFGHTFNWAYDEPSIGLTHWLRKGTGIFWISGKPGSGKSTLMKFLLNDPRTAELLHIWKSKSRQIIVNFFFHHRGTVMQKSFDGLLRSLLSQLLEQERGLWPVIGKILNSKLQENLQSGRYGAIQSDVRWFFHASGCQVSDPRQQNQLAALLSQDPISHLDAVFRHLFPANDKAGELVIKRMVLNEYSTVCNSIGSRETLDYEIKRIWRKLRWVDPQKFTMFQQLIETWSNRIDIEMAIWGFLKRYKLHTGPLRRSKDFDLYIQKSPNLQKLDSYIRKLSKRHRCRQQARLDIQLAVWTRPEVEKGIARIFDQDVLHLDMCLFFDALDEYDGRPEVISEFLKDLVKQAPSSKTHARVLFSSRPWPIFHEEFQACASFRLHEHTYEDIREYCTGLLPDGDAAKALILPLIRDITSRARGVFLWVKLVMRDLIRIATAVEDADEAIPLKLRRCLDAIPAELHDYYSTIIQRLPSAARSETYVLLESISRSYIRISLKQIPFLIGSGLAHSFEEAKANWRYRWDMGHTELGAYVRTISGGLVDVRMVSRREAGESDSSLTDDYEIQLLHQTCKEWVESARFKHIVLGNRANLSWENGHSFLVKLYAQLAMSKEFSLGSVPKEVLATLIFAHLQHAEVTTGVSQYAYLCQLPPDFYHIIFPRGYRRSNLTGLSLATCRGLWLYLRDAVSHDKHIIRNTKEPLFSVLLSDEIYQNTFWLHENLPTKVAPTLGVEVGKFLLDHGFSLEKDPTGVSELMKRLWESPDRLTAQLYIDLVIDATKRPLTFVIFIPVVSELFSREERWSLLHLSPPPLARWLLQCGVGVNILNSHGKTPLDYVLDPDSVHQAYSFGMDWLYEVACLLIEHGGILQCCTPAHLESFIAMLTNCGFETGLFSSLQLPMGPVQSQSIADQVQQTGIMQQDIAMRTVPTDAAAETSHPTMSQQRQRKRDTLKRLFTR